MKVVSKFLTAEVRIVRVAIEGRQLVVEGMVKEIMPMRVEMGLDDAKLMARALVAGLRERLAGRPSREAAVPAVA
ncbi:MAG: hypothetical protein M5U28_19215 [Sandaracinaceae bacterium]|nr:hypothetical protein [Sandaracinaceae bacterium]